MRFDVITLFPKVIEAYANASILGRAQEKKLIHVQAHQLRDFASGTHRTVDSPPYGGGAGMVLKIEPIYRAVERIKRQATRKGKTRIILFSTRGRKFDATIAKRLTKYDQLILICGRYEGVDERVARHIADEEISMGDFVLTGGELPALVMIDAVSRFIPGALGKRESLEEVQGSYPVYTRPEEFWPERKTSAKGGSASGGENSKLKTRSWRVPKVLLSGNHREIAEWRKKFGS